MEEVEENECRICRCPGEAGNPLRYPCACRGTIKYVHQYCLLQWLNHRKISHCDVLQDGVFHFLPNIIDPKNFYNGMIECPMFKHACDILLLVGIHGSLMVMLVFLPIKLVILYVPFAFLLNLLSLLHFGVPCTVHLYYPSKTFKVLLHKWVIFICSLINSSDFLLPRNGNNGGHVEQLRPQRVSNVLVVATTEGSIVGPHTQRNTDAAENGSGDGLEADSQFALRVRMLLVLACMTALVFNSLMMVVPLLLGRALSEAAAHLLICDGFKSDVWCRTCSNKRRKVSFKPNTTVLYDSLQDLRSLLSLGIFVIPTVVGLLLDLVLIVPIPFPLDELSIITFFQCWVLGWLFFITLVGLIMIDSVHSVDERWLGKLQRVLDNGLVHRHTLSVLIEFLIVLSITYMLTGRVLTMLGCPFPVNSAIHWIGWPGYFALSVMWFSGKLIHACVTYLHKKIRDDRYRMGQRLRDFGEDVHGRQSEERKALELQN